MPTLLANLMTEKPTEYSFENDVIIWETIREHFLAQRQTVSKASEIPALFNDAFLKVTTSKEDIAISEVDLPFWENRAAKILMQRYYLAAF